MTSTYQGKVDKISPDLVMWGEENRRPRKKSW